MSGPSGGQRWPWQRLLSPHSCRSPGAPFSAGARPPPNTPHSRSLLPLSSSLSSPRPSPPLSSLVAPSIDPAAFAALPSLVAAAAAAALGSYFTSPSYFCRQGCLMLASPVTTTWVPAGAGLVSCSR